MNKGPAPLPETIGERLGVPAVSADGKDRGTAAGDVGKRCAGLKQGRFCRRDFGRQGAGGADKAVVPLGLW